MVGRGTVRPLGGPVRLGREMRPDVTLLLLLSSATLGSRETVAEEEASHGRDLSVNLWRVFPDTAVFDWYITLAEKHRF